MTIIANINVIVWAIKVDEKYLNFKYEIFINGEPNRKGEYSSDHVWRDDVKRFKELLKNGYATQLALEQINKIEFKPTPQ